MHFKQQNLILGWISFLIALIVYLLTLEPTVSLWDCGEFIASSYKLQVGHPPGAPLFMMIGRVFSLFASDTGPGGKNDQRSFSLCQCFHHLISLLDHLPFP